LKGVSRGGEYSSGEDQEKGKVLPKEKGKLGAVEETRGVWGQSGMKTSPGGV